MSKDPWILVILATMIVFIILIVLSSGGKSVCIEGKMMNEYDDYYMQGLGAYDCVSKGD
jgi:short subunit fatty acids transporter